MSDSSVVAIDNEPAPECTYPSLDVDPSAYPELPADIKQYCLPKVPGQSFIQAQLPWNRIEKHPKFENSRGAVFGTSELEAGIEAQGLEEPLVVWRHYSNTPMVLPDGTLGYDRFFLVSGFRREGSLSNIRERNIESFDANFPRIPVHIFEGDLITAMYHNLSENANRQNPTAVEFGNYVIKMRDLGVSNEEISQRTGMSTAWVSSCATLVSNDNISKEVLDAVSRRTIDFRTAKALAKDTKEAQKIWIEEYDQLLETGETKKAKTKKREKKSSGRTVRIAKLLQEQRDEYLNKDISSYVNDMRTLYNKLEKEDLELLQSAMILAHIYGIQKALIWACGEDVDWFKANPPFGLEANGGGTEPASI